MEKFILQNITWIIGSAAGVIVWLIRLEGKVKENRQRADLQAENLKQQMDAELAARDAEIKAVKETAEHLTRMGENLKGTLQPLLEKVAGLDAKVDILLERIKP